MHDEQGDVITAATTCTSYVILEVLSANGFYVAVLTIGIFGDPALGMPRWMLEFFVGVMVIWGLSLGFLGNRLVKVAVRTHTNRALPWFLARNIVAGFALSLAWSAVAKHHDTIVPILAFLNTHGIAHPSQAAAYPIIAGTALCVWAWLRWPVLILFYAYADIGCKWLRRTIAKRVERS